LRAWSVVPIVLACAGCAVGPASLAPEEHAPLPLLAAAPPPGPFVVTDIALVPVVVRDDPFPSAAGAELEPLPAPAANLWDRIVDGYSIPDLIDDPLVAKWERYYAARPDYVARIVDRSRRYLYHIVGEIDEKGLPRDLALLPMIESAYNPNAISSARASGLWQFIPSTGKHYGLKQDFWADSRRDVLAATNSALDYLAKLHDDFGDWQLALAAYNWGEGNVGRAVAKNKARGKGADYLSLSMPAETRNYLPKFQAVKNIVRDPEKYGLELAEVPDTPYFTIVKAARPIDVKAAADLAEMTVEDFLSLNPQHNRPVIAGGDAQSILLPIDRAEVFAAKLQLSDQPLVSWQAYRMKPGETLPQVAAKFALEVETLRAVNGIGPRSAVPNGHALLVPAQRPSDATAESLENTVFTTVPSGRTIHHTVRRGETLDRLAVRYGVTADDLKRWNNMKGDALKAGQQVRVTTQVATGGRSKSRPAASAAKARKPASTPPSARANGARGG